jgi:TRAP-type transport system periplasmic protein
MKSPFKSITLLIIGMLVIHLAGTPLQAAQKPITLKISTLAPEGSPWVNEFQALNKEVQELSGNRLKFKIYPGGILGNDDVIIRKIRVGQLDGATFTSIGLCKIFKDFQALTLPRLFNNTSEVDHIIGKLQPDMQRIFRDSGYEPLGFTGLGFTYMFTQKEIPNAKAMKSTKAWLLENDPVMKAIYKAAGVTPISVSIGDVMTALQTGLLDTVFNTPSGLLALQWFTKVDNMIDVPLTYSLGGFLVSNRAWNKLPEDLQTIVRDQVNIHLENITRNSRNEDQRALEIMVQRGLVIKTPSAELMTDFSTISKTARNSLVGKEVTPEMFEKINTLLSEYRSSHQGNE